MTSNLFSRFDDYVLWARVSPGLLTLSPAIITFSVLLPTLVLKIASPILLGTFGAYFLANVVRGMGKNLEKKLVRQWDGMPTTHMLRLRESQENMALFSRRRERLAQLTNMSLPSQRVEARSPSTADDTYVAMVRILINRVRDRGSEFPRVHEENISYGFRRNLRALKTVGISIVIFLIPFDASYWHSHGDSSLLNAILAIQSLFLLLWVFIVTTEWVKQAGFSYAERLFECLESLI